LLKSPEERGNGYTVYPNPLSSVLYIEYAGKEKEALIRVFDVVGRSVMVMDHVTVGFSPVALDMSNLLAGVYIISITDKDGKSEKIKVVKQ